MISSAIRNRKSENTRSVEPHPARFPEKLPAFCIEFLTDPGDLPAPSVARQAGTVLDIFAGSNTTGRAAAGIICHVKSAISNQAERGAAFAFRFVDELPADELATLWSRLNSDDLPWRQREL